MTFYKGYGFVKLRIIGPRSVNFIVSFDYIELTVDRRNYFIIKRKKVHF